MSDTNTTANRPAKLTKSYLALLGSSFASNYGVTVKQTQSGFWIITVQFDGQEEGRAVTTERGDMKVWRNVIGAISFVQDNCALASTVFVEVGGWRLSRIETIV